MRSRKLYSWISLIVLASMILACGGLGGGGDPGQRSHPDLQRGHPHCALGTRRPQRGRYEPSYHR